ncbi:MetQ/NlpA family ABC transporter substrate-binding protein [Streptomyces katsurahamanus]|uniref:Lipoprotein n=1 Tax=Streptomyces katsurahamanus TaxID=2577098 RepID=A0ABW9NZQ7_9ACTN|nr:MetQ/NlpA family ABC transporter substrate-binding protein [Streptomyces katsurahamanus]MQS38639.1 ABC transporter substrate-binding protein [Streptomyces katsurahamanus]
MRNTIKITTAVLATGALALGLTACGTEAGSDSVAGSGSADKTLVVAASTVPHAEILGYVKDNLAAKEDLKLEVKEFTDYVTPNTATQNGEVGANYFQHKPYLDDFNKKNGTTIVPVVTVHLEPLGVYSKKTESLTALKDGATVALPNDTTNEARALKLLERNGLIKLKPGAGNEATPKDIAENPKKLQFKELEAAQIPRVLDEVDAAVINGNYAVDADLSPKKDSLVLESAEDNPYGNFLAVKKGNEDAPQIKKLAKLLQSPEVKKFIEDEYDGSVIPAF